MREKAVTFGKSSSLVGILTEPENQEKQLPAVLFWNAGLQHRVGPFRLYVDMSRKLAEMGYLVFRFDLSGKGDSELLKENILEKERAIQDIQAAMDTISQKNGKDSFVLVGLCSGADDAFPAALRDERISGLVLLDGFGYRTVGFYLHHYLPRSFRWAPWRNFIRRNLNHFFRIGNNRKNQDILTQEVYVRDFPARAEAKADLLRLVGNGVNFLFIYSGGVRENYYNYKNQFRHMFWPIKLNEKLQVEYFSEAAHTYTRIMDRTRLMNCIFDWMNRHYNNQSKDPDNF